MRRSSGRNSQQRTVRQRVDSRILFALWMLLPLFTTSGVRADTPAVTAADKSELFEKKVRPLLAENCLSCHGAASRPPMGNLRLDTAAGLRKGGDRGPVLAPARPLDSPLLVAVRYEDPHFQMPPKGKLSAEQIAVLTEWVKMGAPFPEGTGKAQQPKSSVPNLKSFDMKTRMRHWAWQPVRAQAVPVVKNKAWCRTPIDTFVLARLESRGLKPAPPTDARTLLRRVTYDLIGLPPTPQEIATFLADRSPNAYEKVVDRLLASPHYGERWGRHWLDLVRYAETDGHEWDYEKTGAWQYRDWVIRALNADVPYNRFVQEHLAGDLLPRPRLNPADHFNESLLGTGWLWLGSGKHSPVDLRDDEAERVDNQIDVLGKTFLGIGVGCARCHDHKFDAISAKDYYALYGFLKSARQQITAVGRPLDPQLRKALVALNMDVQQTTLQGAANALVQQPDFAARVGSKEWAEHVQAAKNDPAAFLHPWAVLSAPDVSSSPDAFRKTRDTVARRLMEQAERAKKESGAITWLWGPESNGAERGWYISGEAFDGDVPPVLTASRVCGPLLTLRATSLTARPDSAKKDRIGAAFYSAADSGRVSDKLQGALRSSTFTIEKPHLFYQLTGRDARVRLIIEGYQQIRDPLYGGLQFDVDSPDRPTWRVQDVKPWIGHRAFIELADNGNGFLAVQRVGQGNGDPPVASPNPLMQQMLEDPALNSVDSLTQRYDTLLRQAAQWLLAGQPANRPDGDACRDLMADVLPSITLPAPTVTRLTELLQQRAKLEAQIAVPQAALATADGTGETERVHLRGNYRTPGPLSPRRFLEACGGSAIPRPDEGSGRLLLAQRMTSPANPLLARVIVNRVWQHHFGEGIVRTPDDFGVMGELPTHPELLDWLAGRFTAKIQDTKIQDTRHKIQAGKPASAFSCDWSLKKLHRLMVLSSAYRMSSQTEARAESADPQNRLLHRMPVRRLEAECIRDSALAVSGRLDPKLYGPPIMPHLTAFTPGRGAPVSGPVDGAGRRSIYLSIRRNFPIPLLMAFDCPVPTTTIGRRTVSSVPAQALTLLNDPFFVEQAGVWAKRVLAEQGDAAQRVNALYETAFSRPPTAAERDAALAFLTQQAQGYGAPDDAHAWADLCHVLFNVKEFIFVR
jgi:mono/diheme cytochrome c family protein